MAECQLYSRIAFDFFLSHSPGYPTPLALNIPSANQNFSLANVSIPIGQGFVVLMTDIYNSSNIVSESFPSVWQRAERICRSTHKAASSTSQLPPALRRILRVPVSALHRPLYGRLLGLFPHFNADMCLQTILSNAPAGGDATALATTTAAPEFNTGMGSMSVAMPTRMVKRVAQRAF